METNFNILCEFVFISRKPTTLWKRWKPSFSLTSSPYSSLVSETHYSLKEMETNFNILCEFVFISRKPTTLWKRWKPSFSLTSSPYSSLVSETHYSLKEMETRINFPIHRFAFNHRRKPTTLWKRWKLFTVMLVPRFVSTVGRKPTTLWKRWKLPLSVQRRGG